VVTRNGAVCTVRRPDAYTSASSSHGEPTIRYRAGGGLPGPACGASIVPGNVPAYQADDQIPLTR